MRKKKKKGKTQNPTKLFKEFDDLRVPQMMKTQGVGIGGNKNEKRLKLCNNEHRYAKGERGSTWFNSTRYCDPFDSGCLTQNHSTESVSCSLTRSVCALAGSVVATKEGGARKIKQCCCFSLVFEFFCLIPNVPTYHVVTRVLIHFLAFSGVLDISLRHFFCLGTNAI